jgi:hypothetical protein
VTSFLEVVEEGFPHEGGAPLGFLVQGRHGGGGGGCGMGDGV